MRWLKEARGAEYGCAETLEACRCPQWTACLKGAGSHFYVLLLVVLQLEHSLAASNEVIEAKVGGAWASFDRGVFFFLL